jgi:hypothetical protein
MKASKFFFAFSITFALALCPLRLLAAAANNQGVFTSVNGKVSIKSASGTTRLAKKDSTVREGERISAGADSSATLKFFDGSELKVSPKTDFRLSQIQKREDGGKVLKFKLMFGRLLAKVQKLTTKKSAFEIDGGGVVCGVRGTEYSMQYNPDTGKVDIFVLDGTVWANSGNQSFTYGAGQGGHFTNGHPDPNNGQGGNQGKGNNFNPFYGLNGNQQNPMDPLVDNPESNNDVANQTGNDNLQGLGAHTVLLQFGYPEQ